MSGHHIKKCKNCDTVIEQCRCPSETKTVEWGDCGCEEQQTNKEYCDGCEMQCPVCGYYCLGKKAPAIGCIDKPNLPEHTCSLSNKEPYGERDHGHCWDDDNPPCGQKIEHLKCCICEKLNPIVKPCPDSVHYHVDGEHCPNNK